MPKVRPSLLSTHPEIAARAHGWNPDRYVPSTFPGPWKCDNGHIYTARLDHLIRGIGCGYCANRRVLAGYNDIATTHPDLAAQAHGWDPTTVIAGSNTPRDWICNLGHTWSADPNHRAYRGQGCPTCSGKRVLPGFNDLATVNPDLAAQAAGWDPTTVTGGCDDHRAWKCDNDHTWTARIANRHYLNRGCPICTNQLCSPGINDLATTNPDIAAEAHGWDPTTLTAGSAERREFKCAQGHIWKAQVRKRATHDQTGCPTCANKRVLAGFNDLATTHPAIAAQAHGWNPTHITAGNSESRAWKCDLGHTWNAVPYIRTGTQASGCPTCANKVLLPGFNDLATTHPDVAAQADGWDPSTCFAGHNKHKAWICARGHRWNATVNSRTSAASCGCPYCGNKKVLPGFNDLATTHPDLAAQAHGWDTTTVVAGTNQRRDWICDEGHTWTASIAQRSGAGTGCPQCNTRRGFAPAKPGTLYLQGVYTGENTNDPVAYKIGITNAATTTLRTTAQQRGLATGYTIRTLHAITHDDGVVIQQAEREILTWWRQELGHPAYLHRKDMTDGWSETVSADAAPLKEITTRMKRATNKPRATAPATPTAAPVIETATDPTPAKPSRGLGRIFRAALNALNGEPTTTPSTDDQLTADPATTAELDAQRALPELLHALEQQPAAEAVDTMRRILDDLSTPTEDKPARARIVVEGKVTDLLTAGLLTAGETLTSRSKKYPATATVNADGTIHYNGHNYPTPSAAACAAVGRLENGWSFFLTTRGGENIQLADIRNTWLAGRTPHTPAPATPAPAAATPAPAPAPTHAASTHTAPTKARRKVYTARMADLLHTGAITAGETLRFNVRKHPVTAVINADGTIHYNGTNYPTPSAAASAIEGRHSNGWGRWTVKRDGRNIKLETLRSTVPTAGASAPAVTTTQVVAHVEADVVAMDSWEARIWAALQADGVSA